MNLNLNDFVKKFVIKREESLLNKDLLDTKNKLSAEINNKSVLVIGGAGTIGSSYIKALLKFKPTKLVVVDINENGLTELVRDLRSSKALNIPKNIITYPLDFGDKIFDKIYGIDLSEIEETKISVFSPVSEKDLEEMEELKKSESTEEDYYAKL